MTSRAAGAVKRLWAEQLLITSLAGLALLVMVIQTVLSDTPELFAGGAKIGKLSYDLALAYFAAWLFNLLVVVLPRWREQARVLRAVSGYIQGVSGGARSVLQAMANSANLPLSDPATPQEVSSLCAATDPNGNALMVTFSQGGLAPVPWLAYLQDEASRVGRFHELLVPAYQYFDSELVALLRGAFTNSYIEQIRHIGATPVRNGDLAWLAGPLYQYSETCRRIDEYYKTHVKPVVHGQEARELHDRHTGAAKP